MILSCACRAQKRRDGGHKRNITHRNMVKLHLIARDTFADTSESDDDGPLLSQEPALGSEAALEPHLPRGADLLMGRGQNPGRIAAHHELSNADQYKQDITPVPEAVANLRISAALRQSRRALSDHNAVPRAPTPDLSSVPDTPKGDLCLQSERKTATDGCMQRRSSLLRTALHAAAACASGQAGAKRR